MKRGYIKLWRKIKDSFVWEDPQILKLFLHIVTEANYKRTEFLFNNKKQTLERGQLICGRHQLSSETGINESKIYRTMDILEREQLIEQQKTNLFTIVTVINYNIYQPDEQQTEQPVNNQRTTSEQPVNTSKELIRTNKKEKNILSCKQDPKEPILYLNLKTGKNFSPKNKTSLNMIRARINEGRTLTDFTKVIDRKCSQWLTDEKMIDYLRPKTLFNATNFENYINEKDSESFGIDKIRAKFGLGKE